MYPYRLGNGLLGCPSPCDSLRRPAQYAFLRCQDALKKPAPAHSARYTLYLDDVDADAEDHGAPPRRRVHACSSVTPRLPLRIGLPHELREVHEPDLVV